ncbi:MAG: metallophosphoesterase [Patescibacteria group bacterium]|nr:metallophosphoesterase [Patescibacteria group bacterium]
MFSVKNPINSKVSLAKKVVAYLAMFVVVMFVVTQLLIDKKHNSEALRIGYITDLEYGNQTRTGSHLNSSAKEQLENIVSYFNAENRPDIVIGGGDYVKGSHVTKDKSLKQLKEINNIFKKVKSKKLYCIGNQDLKHLSKEEVRKALSINYSYTSKDTNGVRLIIMDNNYKIASDKEYDGARLGKKELDWLKKELTTEMPVLVFSHYSPVPIPTKSGWGKDFHNADKLTELFEKHNNVVAVISGNSSRNSLRKEGGIPYISVAGLTDIDSLGNFAEFELLLNGDDLKMTVSYKKAENGQFELTRKISDHHSLEISELAPINPLKGEILWHDLIDQNNKNGKISELKGTETNIAVSESGQVYLAFQDGKYNNSAHIKMYDGKNWHDLADKKHQKGLISKQKGCDPYLEINGNAVYVAFEDLANGARARVKKWDGGNWSDLSDAQSPLGLISKLRGREPVLTFDRSKKYLYAAFGSGDQDDTECRKTCQIKIKKWDGRSWSNVADAQFPEGVVSEKRAAEVDIVASKRDTSIFIAFEDLDNNNHIRVKKWDGESWSDVSDNFHRDDTATKIAGSSPSLAINQKNELILIYTGKNNKNTYATKWNGSNWENIGDGIVSSNRNIESCVAVGNKLTDKDNIYVAYSYFKENAQSLKDRERKGKLTKKVVASDMWLMRVERWNGEEWMPLFDQNNPDGLISKGNGKGDPSIATHQNTLFISFTDKKTGNGARVRKYEKF